MKSLRNIQNPATAYLPLRFFAGIIFYLSLFMSAYAGTGYENTKDEMQNDTSSVKEEKVKEKAPVRMSFEAYIINDSVKLVARVRSKVGAKFKNTAGIEISFYTNEIDPANLIGKIVSNTKGESVWMLSAGELPDSIAPIPYIASVKDNPDYEEVEETVSVQVSKMMMELTEEDSIRWVKVFVGIPDASGQVSPVPEAECKIYVKRLFGLLQIGDKQTTDEEGNISLELPHEIQGDETGNIMLVAKIAGHEVLGNVEVSKTIGWGIPTKVDLFYREKELWSARANSPLLLIIIVNVVLVGIWAVICFIFLEIFRINRFGKVV
jgi:hypothetical protein